MGTVSPHCDSAHEPLYVGCSGEDEVDEIERNLGIEGEDPDAEDGISDQFQTKSFRRRAATVRERRRFLSARP